MKLLFINLVQRYFHHLSYADNVRYDDYATLIILVMITNLVSPHLQARLPCFSPALLESKVPPPPENYTIIYQYL